MLLSLHQLCVKFHRYLIFQKIKARVTYKVQLVKDNRFLLLTPYSESLEKVGIMLWSTALMLSALSTKLKLVM